MSQTPEQPDRDDRASATPRWVKVSALVAVVVVALLVVMLLVAPGGHGPGRHLGVGGGGSGHTGPPPGIQHGTQER